MLNQKVFKHLTDNYIVQGYLNDFLGMIALLVISNMLLSFHKEKDVRLKSFIKIFTFSLVVGIFWECGTPFYKVSSVTDIYDIVVYQCGAVFYYIILKVGDLIWKMI
jgi:hypothetical protein